MTYLTIRQGDTMQIISDSFTYNGSPLNLTGATVYLAFENRITKDSVTRTATITDDAGGEVEYQLVADDVANTGRFFLQWQIEAPTGDITLPQDSEIELRILSKI